MSEPLVLISGPPFGAQHAAAARLAGWLPRASVMSLDEHPFGPQAGSEGSARIAEALDAALGPVLAPVTPRDPRSLLRFLVPVLALGHDVRHVVLVRTLDDVRRRLHPGKDDPIRSPGVRAGVSWADLAPCVETTGRSITEIAAAVATTVGLSPPG